MKRLIKKADHDILNRDFAIVYCNGKFYTGITHAYCLNNIKKDNKEVKLVLKSYQMRPDFDQFTEVSEKVGPVVLAHCVAKEEGVFLDVGFIDGEALLFDDIPDSIKNEFKEEYDMPVYDEMKHGDVNMHDPKQNPYYNEIDKKSEELNNTMQELDKTEEAEEFLENNGYKYDSENWIYVNEEGIAVDISDASCTIHAPLQEVIECQTEDIENTIKNVKNPIVDILDKFVGKGKYSIIFKDFIESEGLYEISFENNYNQTLYFKCVGDRLNIIADGIDITYDIKDYCPDGEFDYTRDMEMLMDFYVDDEIGHE